MRALPPTLLLVLWGASAQAMTTFITETEWGPDDVATTLSASLASAGQEIGDGFPAPSFRVSDASGSAGGAHMVLDETFDLSTRRLDRISVSFVYKYLSPLYSGSDISEFQEAGLIVGQDGSLFSYLGNLAAVSGAFNDGDWHRFAADGLSVDNFTKLSSTDPFAALDFSAGAGALTFGLLTISDLGATVLYDDLEIQLESTRVPLPATLPLLAAGAAGLGLLRRRRRPAPTA